MIVTIANSTPEYNTCIVMSSCITSYFKCRYYAQIIKQMPSISDQDMNANVDRRIPGMSKHVHRNSPMAIQILITE